MDLIEPQEFQLDCQDGKTRTYVLSKFPAVTGREILAKYIGSSMPKLGDYPVNEEMMLKMMGYVEAKSETGNIRLVSEALINNHVRSTKDLTNLEDQMFHYNYGFFLREKVLNFFDAILGMIQARLQEMSMASSGQSSPTVKPPFTN